MTSFSWPNMLNSATSNLVSDKEAIRSNFRLLLNCEKRSLFGDPNFGVGSLKFNFEQNTPIIADLIIDELYTAIQTFLPQIFVRRSDIKIFRDKIDLFAEIKCIYKLDNTSDLYVINLTSENLSEG